MMESAGVVASMVTLASLVVVAFIALVFLNP